MVRDTFHDSGGQTSRDLTESEMEAGKKQGRWFGCSFKKLVDETQSSTTSDTWQEKLSLSADLSEGRYYVKWECELGSADAKQVRVHLELDDTTELDLVRVTPTIATPSHYPKHGGSVVVDLTEATHTFDLDWRSGTIGEDSRVRKARIYMWRLR